MPLSGSRLNNKAGEAEGVKMEGYQEEAVELTGEFTDSSTKQTIKKIVKLWEEPIQQTR